MTATTSIRTQVRGELITRMTPHPALVSAAGLRVPITPGLPGDKIEREHVFVARITGTRKVTFLQAGRKTIEDDFTITFVFMVSIPGATTLEADDRVEVMASALEDVLADDPALADAQGVPLDGLLWAVAGTWDGPDHELTSDGAVSFMRCDVDCKARYL
jgi:hypothetical protein